MTFSVRATPKFFKRLEAVTLWRHHTDMMKRRAFLTLGGALLVAACATDTPIAGPVPQVGFQHLEPIRLMVADVKLSNGYQSPLKAPNAEHRFATSPAQAMLAWAKSRLQAVGDPQSEATARFVIEEASVIETKLKKSEGFTGMFTYEPTERYDATIRARLSIQGGLNGGGGEVLVSAQRSTEVSENATLAEREQAWFAMTEALMTDFNAQMETEVNGYLARWLHTPGLK